MTSKHDFQWDDVTIKALVRLKNEGRTATEIASTLGAPSRNAVLGKLNRLGMCERKPSSRHRPAVTVSRFERHGATTKADRIERTRILAAETASKFMPDWANMPLAGAKPVKLVDLTSRSCRWPLDTEKGVLYCGCDTPKAGMSYCPSHQAVSTSAAARTPEQVRLVAAMSGFVAAEIINLNSQP